MGLVEGSGFLGVHRAGKRQVKENIFDDVVLASLIFDLEVVFRKAKDPAFDPGGRGQISSKEIAKGCVICSQEKFFAEQKHSEMFDGSNHCVEFNFISSGIALRAGKGPREEAHWVLEARIIKALFEHCSDCDATVIGLENEKALEIR